MRKVRVGKLVFDGWAALEYEDAHDGCQFTDTFIMDVHPFTGLQPHAYAVVMKRMMRPLLSLRPSASLWFRVQADGSWYQQVLHEKLRGLPVPFVVTGYDDVPERYEFSFRIWSDSYPSQGAPKIDSLIAKYPEMPPGAWKCLRVMAHLSVATSADVAALAGITKVYAIRMLKLLRKYQYVSQIADLFLWRVRRRGVSAAMRSIGIVPGVNTTERKERKWQVRRRKVSDAMRSIEITPETNTVERKRLKKELLGNRHRRISRRWGQILQEGWPGKINIWGIWSEATVGRMRPDSLGWGSYQNEETLFWLEVESGTRKGSESARKISNRFYAAFQYARAYRVSLIFTVLSPKWVRNNIYDEMEDRIPDEAALVLGSWVRPGETLPLPKKGSISIP